MTSTGNPASPGSAPCLLSLCMIVKNEHANLATCLNSVRGVVGEMIVVDTGSTDGTQALAETLGARLIQTTWANDFSQARNLAIAHATGRWILVLDADESLRPSDREPLRQLLIKHTSPLETPNLAFNLINLSTSDGGRTGMTAYLVRVFPNRPEVRYSFPIHEQVAPSLNQAGIQVVNTDLVIYHTGYSDPALNRAKQRRNGEILLAQIAARHDVTPMTFFQLGGCHLDLDDPAKALECYAECHRLAQTVPGQEEFAQGAVVRIVECLVRLKRFSEALPFMPQVYDPAWPWHPETLIARGVIEKALGRVDEARGWYERVFACEDRPRIPACNLAGRKGEALKFLADYWQQAGRPTLALALLRAGVSVRQQGRDFTAQDLAQCYAAFLPTTPV